VREQRNEEGGILKPRPRWYLRGCLEDQYLRYATSTEYIKINNIWCDRFLSEAHKALPFTPVTGPVKS